MALLGGADEVVVGNVHDLPELLGVDADLVHVRLRGDALFRGLALDLLAVLVQARQEERIVSLQRLSAPGYRSPWCSRRGRCAGCRWGNRWAWSRRRCPCPPSCRFHTWSFSLLKFVRGAPARRKKTRALRPGQGRKARGTTLFFPLRARARKALRLPTQAEPITAFPRRGLGFFPLACAAPGPCSRAQRPPALTDPGSLWALQARYSALRSLYNDYNARILPCQA